MNAGKKYRISKRETIRINREKEVALFVG